MKGIKTQYIFAITFLFSVVMFTFLNNVEPGTQETYKEVPNDYLKRDRSLAQVERKFSSQKNTALFQRKKRDIDKEHYASGNNNSYKRDNDKLLKKFDYNKNNRLSLVQNFKAIPKTNENTERFPNSPLKGNFIIVGKDESVDGALSLVVNTTEEEIGIFFDIVKIKLKSDDKSLMFNILSRFDYELVESYDHLNLYLFKFVDSLEAIRAYEYMKSKDFAKRISLEIKYHFRQFK